MAPDPPREGGDGRGLPPETGRFRVLCSALAHFCVARPAAQLGLGTAAVVAVAVDAAFRICPADLGRQRARLARDGLIPIAGVATAGTTDIGSIDPLAAAAGRAAGARVHVDAASGRGCSSRRGPGAGGRGRSWRTP